MSLKWMNWALQHANKIAKKMENTIIEAESNWLVISFNWKMEVQNVFFEKKDIISKEKELTDAIKKCLEKATIHVQKLAWEEYWKAIQNFQWKK